MYRTIHNEGIFEDPQMLDNNQLPDKAYKNSDNGGLMTKMTFRSIGETTSQHFCKFCSFWSFLEFLKTETNLVESLRYVIIYL